MSTTLEPSRLSPSDQGASRSLPAALSRVRSGEEEISPREVAELLGVSRPFASRLFDEGQIPSRRVGTHRRAFVKDVLAYRERQHAAGLAALDELAAEGQRLNLGY